MFSVTVSPTWTFACFSNLFFFYLYLSDDLEIFLSWHMQQSSMSADVLTPCSSSFSRVSRTFGEFEAKRRQCRFSSGMMNSSSLLGDKPLGVVWRAAEGTDSSRMEPRSVFIWGEDSHLSHPVGSIEHTLNSRTAKYEFYLCGAKDDSAIVLSSAGSFFLLSTEADGHWTEAIVHAEEILVFCDDNTIT